MRQLIQLSWFHVCNYGYNINGELLDIPPTADDESCVYPPTGSINLEYEVVDGNNLEINWSDPEFGTSPFYHHVRIFSDFINISTNFVEVRHINNIKAQVWIIQVFNSFFESFRVVIPYYNICTRF